MPERGQAEPDIAAMQNRKLFVGGLHMKTDENSLKSYFERFGKVVDCIVMRDQNSKRSRGFGFVSFEESTSLEDAQRQRPHKIDDKEVDCKRAMPLGDYGIESHVTTTRLWIGGVNETTTEEAIREHFSQFGTVQKVEFAEDTRGASAPSANASANASGESASARKLRGFGFVTFEDYDSVDKAMLAKPHIVAGRTLEVRKGLTKADWQRVNQRRNARFQNWYGQPHFQQANYANFAPPGATTAYPSANDYYGAYPYNGYGYTGYSGGWKQYGGGGAPGGSGAAGGAGTGANKWANKRATGNHVAYSSYGNQQIPAWYSQGAQQGAGWSSSGAGGSSGWGQQGGATGGKSRQSGGGANGGYQGFPNYTDFGASGGYSGGGSSYGARGGGARQ